MNAPGSGVTVRMYRTQVGDCLLLAFRGADDKPFHLLIDCGIHAQCAGGSTHIRRVVEHLERATGGHLNLVVVTHEHGDHVSGFYRAEETFKRMKIDRAWFGWTEDPEDDRVKELDRVREKMLQGLEAHHRLAANSDAAKRIRPLLGFFELGDGFGMTTRGARDKVVALAREREYLKPKTQPRALPGVDDVRVFVLGPPEKTEFLKRARPSKSGGEVYQDEALALALIAAADPDPGSVDDALVERYQPVAGNHRLPVDIVKAQRKAHAFFHEHYGFKKGDASEWRRIDDDWLSPAESLALKLDSATNNTSLVLAIELMKSKRVLLFPGDAQVGNWQSWHDGGWSEKNGLKPGETISAEDLLNRTVLYKVGHHGSHNATLREKGLEMMVSPELTAMIPVDQKWAHERQPHAWKMPFDPLYEDLKKRTRGRILRSDLGLVTPKDDPVWGPFKADEDKLYVEVTIPDE